MAKNKFDPIEAAKRTAEGKPLDPLPEAAPATPPTPPPAPAPEPVAAAPAAPQAPRKKYRVVTGGKVSLGATNVLHLKPGKVIDPAHYGGHGVADKLRAAGIVLEQFEE